MFPTNDRLHPKNKRMIVGCCKETKDCENRVGLTPDNVLQLVNRGHKVLIEKDAGIGSGISNDDYTQAGATIHSKRVIFDDADMIVKVKEPLSDEIHLFHEGQILFAFLHLAANKALTEELLSRKIVGIAYESIELPDGSLPILAPMSIIAGKLAPQVGVACLQSDEGGKGILIGGAPGVGAGDVLILGIGNVGMSACKIACGLGAHVTIMGMPEEIPKFECISHICGAPVNTCVLNTENLLRHIAQADLVISGIFVRGSRTPKLINQEMLKLMRPYSVIVDVAVDQGGTAETSRPTTHSNPTYIIDDIVHYCVTNIPGIVARTSTSALSRAVSPYLLELADKGINFGQIDWSISKWINVINGCLTNSAIAKSLEMPYTPLSEVSSMIRR